MDDPSTDPSTDIAFARAAVTDDTAAKIRLAADLTQEDIARRLDVALSTVVKWERGQQPSKRLAASYGRLLRQLRDESATSQPESARE